MSAWVTAGYIIGILVGIGVLYWLLRNVVVCGKNCFVDFVRVFCCNPNFGRNWDDDFTNDYVPRSRSTSPVRKESRPSRLLNTPKLPKIPKLTKKASKNAGPARVTKPQKKGKKGGGKKPVSGVLTELETPDLSLLSGHLV